MNLFAKFLVNKFTLTTLHRDNGSPSCLWDYTRNKFDLVSLIRSTDNKHLLYPLRTVQQSSVFDTSWTYLNFLYLSKAPFWGMSRKLHNRTPFSIYLEYGANVIDVRSIFLQRLIQTAIISYWKLFICVYLYKCL